MVDMDRCLLQAKDLLIKFWDEVVYCTNHLLNQILTREVYHVTLFYKWCGKKPSIGYLKAYGSVSWEHISNTLQEEVGCKESCLHYDGIV